MKKVLVTGGAGFIGSAVVRYILNHTEHSVVNVDKLTYAGNLDSLKDVSNHENYFFEQVDICDFDSLKAVFLKYSPDAVMHLAAESHVDRSIENPKGFIDTNIIGTYNLLQLARVASAENSNFRFLHISTDEVFGDLSLEDEAFSETTPYKPSSPYSASKAASDHLVRAWHKTYGTPVLLTNCSNNYGPYHFPEKLIPHMILNALDGKPLPVYGDGQQIRDWLFVDDHARALYSVLINGRIGESYNVGGNSERKNIDVVTTICEILDELRPSTSGSYKELITFVKDRPGHDFRYAINSSKIQNELGWKAEETFESGIRKTVVWFLENEQWWQRVLSGEYKLVRLGEV